MVEKLSTVIGIFLGVSLIWSAFYYLEYSLVGSGCLMFAGICAIYPFTQFFDKGLSILKVLFKSFCVTSLLVAGLTVTMESYAFKVNASEQKLTQRTQKLAIESKKLSALERQVREKNYTLKSQSNSFDTPINRTDQNQNVSNQTVQATPTILSSDLPSSQSPVEIAVEKSASRFNSYSSFQPNNTKYIPSTQTIVPKNQEFQITNTIINQLPQILSISQNPTSADTSPKLSDNQSTTSEPIVINPSQDNSSPTPSILIPEAVSSTQPISSQPIEPPALLPISSEVDTCDNANSVSCTPTVLDELSTCIDTTQPSETEGIINNAQCEKT
jgi:hypothetical protein